MHGRTGFQPLGKFENTAKKSIFLSFIFLWEAHLDQVRGRNVSFNFFLLQKQNILTAADWQVQLPVKWLTQRPCSPAFMLSSVDDWQQRQWLDECYLRHSLSHTGKGRLWYMYSLTILVEHSSHLSDHLCLWTSWWTSKQNHVVSVYRLVPGIAPPFTPDLH